MVLAALIAAGAVLVPAAPARARAPRTFVVADSTLVHGVYPPEEDTECVRDERAPVHLRLPGRVEVGRAADGTLFVINELPFETYVQGIAEVPRDWPMAALRAQVIAARTYALGRLGAGDPDLDYDLCATDACQVYRGMQVSHGPWGPRWRAAVDETRGLALLYEGRPASTLYFSTSNGRTYGNEEVFEGAGPLPYLRGVEERDDGASPLSRWTVSLPLADVTRFLASSGDWSGPDIERIEQEGDDLVVRGGGASARIPKSTFRVAINDRSVCLDPDDYPGEDLEDPERRSVPQTIPSRWYDGRTETGAFVAEGRGWGHGVGMVQWGAYGKARRGLDAGDILAAYYGGLRPRAAGVPETIRVLAAEGLRSVTLVAEGPRSAGDLLSGDGPWRLEPGDPLRVAMAPPPHPVLSARVVAAPARVRAGKTGVVRAEATPGVIATVVLVGDGEAIELPRPRPHRRGPFAQRFEVPATVPEGEYRVVLRMTDGVDSVARRAPGLTRVLAAPVAAPSPPAETSVATSPDESAGVHSALIWGGVVLVLLLAAAVLFRRAVRG